MLSIAYVILPFGDIAPADAIRASLAPFQCRVRGGSPDRGLAFDDNTEKLRHAFEAQFTFTDRGEDRLAAEGDFDARLFVDEERVLDEMRGHRRQVWHIRFADVMDLDSFFRLFSNGVERGPRPDTYGQWFNPLGRWDSWEMGGVFDGRITGQPNHGRGLGVSPLSSGLSWDRMIISKLAGYPSKRVDQTPSGAFDDRSARNMETCATLLADVLADREHAFPESIVLPPGSTEEHLRWLDAFPKPGPIDAFARLGLAPDAKWEELVEQCYLLFRDHWVAGIAYHH